MGGSVEVKSELGVGTSFIINLKTKCLVKQTEFGNIDEWEDQRNFFKKPEETGELECIV